MGYGPRSDARDIQRFWSKVHVTEGCWGWTGWRQGGNRYGMFSVNGKDVGAHRFSYVLHYGPVPEGLVVHHVCNNPPCVRPDHLKAVPQRENRIAYTKTITKCPRGHDYTEDNTYEHPRVGSAQGWRSCRTCDRDRSREYQRKLARERKGDH